ncbi:phage baseplate assembly protein V [Francisella sp. SYW-9]|uniref:phage baseplate assembly protein V n=1 Tax=Francisella sp. SYW-9 TaxID=2610888 RepID=UPI00168D0C35|nr:phage baseplate assembly protein V [Francisella sp. SYW-9]
MHNRELISNIQSRLSQMILIGTIDTIDKAKAKVKIGEITTAFLPIITMRAGDCTTWWSLSESEQVAVLSPSGDINNGIILGSIYTNKNTPQDQTKHITTYADGTVVEYDYKNKKMNIKAVGDIKIDCQNINTSVKDTITSSSNKTDLTVQDSLTLKANQVDISVQDSITISADTVNISAKDTLTLSAKKININSDVVIKGSLVANGVSLTDHIHNDSFGKPTSKPI